MRTKGKKKQVRNPDDAGTVSYRNKWMYPFRESGQSEEKNQTGIQNPHTLSALTLLEQS